MITGVLFLICALNSLAIALILRKVGEIVQLAEVGRAVRSTGPEPGALLPDLGLPLYPDGSILLAVSNGCDGCRELLSDLGSTRTADQDSGIIVIDLSADTKEASDEFRSSTVGDRHRWFHVDSQSLAPVVRSLSIAATPTIIQIDADRRVLHAGHAKNSPSIPMLLATFR